MNYLSYQGNNNNNGGGSWLAMGLIFIFILFAPYIMGNPPQEAADATHVEQDAIAQAAAKALPPIIKYPIASRTLESQQISVTMTNSGGGRIQSAFIKDPDRYIQHGDFIRSQKQDKPEIGGLLPLAVEIPTFGITAETQFEATSPESDSKSASFFYMDSNAQKRITKTFSVSDDNPYIVHAKFDLVNLTANDIQDEIGRAHV